MLGLGLTMVLPDLQAASDAWDGSTDSLWATATNWATLSGARTDQAGTNDWFSVNNVGAQNAVAKVVSGANYSFQDIQVGEAANARAAIYQTGGTLASNRAANVASFRIGGGGSGSYGYYSLSGGTVTSNEFGPGGGAGGLGVMDVSGGQMTTPATRYVTIARGTGACAGVLNVTGGSVTVGRIAANWGNASGGLGVLNGGGGAVAVTTDSSATIGVEVTVSATAGTTGVVNVLSNGTLTTGLVTGARDLDRLGQFQRRNLEGDGDECGRHLHEPRQRGCRDGLQRRWHDREQRYLHHDWQRPPGG